MPNTTTLCLVFVDHLLNFRSTHLSDILHDRQFITAENPVDIQQNQELLFDLAHAADKFGLQACTEPRGRFDLV